MSARSRAPAARRGRDGPVLNAIPDTSPRLNLSVPLLLGTYYTCWTLGANTLGQFKPYLWIDIMGGTPRGASLLILLGIPVGLVLSFVFLRVADAPSRHRWMLMGALVSMSGWIAVTIWPTREAFVFLVVTLVVGASVQGDVAYKMWSQQLVPTLSRTTVQGATLAFARVSAAALAVITPDAASANPRLLFGCLLAASAVAAVTCWWMPRVERRVAG